MVNAWSAVMIAVMVAMGAAAPAAAAPPMWVVSDGDTTVHLVSTVSALRPGAKWRTPALDEAMAKADALWLEVDFLTDTSATDLMTTGGQGKKPLSRTLPAADYDRLQAAAEALGPSMSTLEGQRPWRAAFSLTGEAIRAIGYEPVPVELSLAAEAEARNLPIRGLETGADMVGWYARLTPSEQVAFLVQALDMLEEGPDLFETIAKAWTAGDRATLDTVLVVSLARAGLADALIHRRSRHFANRFDEIMAEPGTRVVAINASHLVGKDALPLLLEARGWQVKLVQGKP